MIKYIFLFILIAPGKEIFCRDVIINGINKNSLHTWKDFTGRPDINTNNEANTFWSLKYDEKTDHSQNHAKQSIWNDLFAGELTR